MIEKLEQYNGVLEVSLFDLYLFLFCFYLVLVRELLYVFFGWFGKREILGH